MIVLMQNDISTAPPLPRSTAWARTFAAVYDLSLWTGEQAGARALRRQLVGRARGFTVEIGSGTGLNLPHYPDDLDELVLAEPDRSMNVRLGKRVHRTGRPRVRVVASPAERLPFPDQSVDTVVSTFVLCTVDVPELALREIARVLRPDGQFLFLEHVRSHSTRLAAWQDRLERPWRRFARGCRCNRATAQLITRCGLVLDGVHEESWRAMPPIVRPLVAGRAQIGTGIA
jgi:ubiquinone/menaquinone biosynthesis C-methylase UbiE